MTSVTMQLRESTTHTMSFRMSFSVAKSSIGQRRWFSNMQKLWLGPGGNTSKGNGAHRNLWIELIKMWPKEPSAMLESGGG